MNPPTPPAPSGDPAPDPTHPPSPTPDVAWIPTRGRRQALDWSLVLASQSIEVWIDSLDSQVQLRLAAADLERAQHAIQRYEEENRARRWWPLPNEAALFHPGALVWCLLLVFLFAVDAQTGETWKRAGLLDPNLVRQGQWWRLSTAMTLHADLAHLSGNLTLGLIFVGGALARLGGGFGILAVHLAGLGGNLLVCAVRAPGERSLGASGVVLGALGVLAGCAVLTAATHRGPRPPIAIWFAGLLLFVLVGLDPSSDVLAHAGGFVTGSLLGAAAAFLPPQLAGQTRPQTLAGTLAITWLILAWSLALP